MKCKICGGTGTSNTCVNGTFKPCTFCDGTGEYEPFDADIELDKLDSEPQTNEEWFCGLSTEEKAKFFKEISEKCTNCGGTIEFDEIGECPFGRCRTGLNEYMDWLKEKHDEM
ncbi:hypothetical protein SAMN04487864_108155 [Succiniclasticum ruminis]|uniref:Uncharacterized protein n=1 Tax=Succiniclasticum ruminis TaxID=40841 RepID=A0A1G6M3D0_9FIRM|nr:hypothetical protein [Succiniclasticum ruminis]SDC49999.1 hypothetical protein SAMN04487864_108155 [Succiniclasticum ruminis]